MKTFLILGSGTGGTMAANKMVKALDLNEWRILVVDREESHYYQPGFLYLPFDLHSSTEIVKPKRNFLPPQAEVIFSEAERIEPDKNRVRLSNQKIINYDYLVLATGSYIRPEETPGMLDGGWMENIFDYYTLEGASALGRFLKTWKGGRLVLNIAEMPIKCPVAPLEFLFLADCFFHKRGIRERVEIVFATPQSGAFNRSHTADILGGMLDEKGIQLEPDFTLMEVDATRRAIRSYDDREIAYDLLVTIPTNMGAEVIRNSGMGDALGFVPADKHTLQAKKWENVWIIGDAGSIPAPKSGSVAHFMLEIVIENILHHMKGEELNSRFDGHNNCVIDSGFDKGIMIDFNYDVEPLPGKFPLPVIGPFSLLRETYMNNWGKKMFPWIYWHILLKGGKVPTMTSHLSMIGKRTA